MNVSEHASPILVDDLMPRSYPSDMLLPMFPDSNKPIPDRVTDFRTTINNVDYRVYTKEKGAVLPTPSDRNVLSLLAGVLAQQIRNGTPSRHLNVPLAELIRHMDGPRSLGGEDYMRARETIERLMGTYIEAVDRTPGQRGSIDVFRWIDSFKYAADDIPVARGSPKMIQIVLSDQAFSFWASNLGFDTPKAQYQAITSNTTSVVRVYEICLTTALKSPSSRCEISMDELHARIPLQCPLKAFKNRALKKALQTINSHAVMSQHLELSLLRKVEGGFIEIPFSKRTPPEEVYIGIEPKDLSHIKPDRLLTHVEISEGVAVM